MDRLTATEEASRVPRQHRGSASSVYTVVRSSRQPLDLDSAGSAAAYVTASNGFLDAADNAVGNATSGQHGGEQHAMRTMER